MSHKVSQTRLPAQTQVADCDNTHTHTAQPINRWHPGATAAPGDGYNTANPATDASERLSRCQGTNISRLSSCFTDLSACRETNITKLQIKCLDGHRSNCVSDVLRDRGCGILTKQPSHRILIIDTSIYLSFYNMSQRPPYSFSNENALKATRAAATLWTQIRSDIVFMAPSQIQTCPKTVLYGNDCAYDCAKGNFIFYNKLTEHHS